TFGQYKESVIYGVLKAFLKSEHFSPESPLHFSENPEPIDISSLYIINDDKDENADLANRGIKVFEVDCDSYNGRPGEGTYNNQHLININNYFGLHLDIPREARTLPPVIGLMPDIYTKNYEPSRISTMGDIFSALQVSQKNSTQKTARSTQMKQDDSDESSNEE